MEFAAFWSLVWLADRVDMTLPSSSVMDHFNNPRNVGILESPDSVGESSLNGRAPRMKLFFKIEANTIRQVTFQTFGCGFSIACCSAITEMMIGQSVEECLSITGERINDHFGGLPDNKRFCADLAVQALRNGLTQISTI